MATSIIKMSKYILVHTTVSTAGQVVAAHSGFPKSVTVTVPDGYEIVGHVAAWHTGQVGIVGGFDTYSTAATLGTYSNNTTNNSITVASGSLAHVLTLCRSV